MNFSISTMLIIFGFLAHVVDGRDYLVGIRATEGSINYCTGALISRRYVLTSVHCSMASRALSGHEDTTQYAMIGSNHIFGGTGGEIIRIIANFQHPDYDSDAFTYDYLLLKLETRTTRTPASMLPVNYAHASPFRIGAFVDVTGWGLHFGPVLEAVTFSMEVLDNAIAARQFVVYDYELTLLNHNTTAPCRTEVGTLWWRW